MGNGPAWAPNSYPLYKLDQWLTETLPSRPISAYNRCIDVYLPNCIGAK